jgi:hypothetical protein
MIKKENQTFSMVSNKKQMKEWIEAVRQNNPELKSDSKVIEFCVKSEAENE